MISDDQLNQATTAEMVRLHRDMVFSSIAATLLVGLVVVAALWGSVDTTLLISWMLVLWLGLIARLWVRFAHGRATLVTAEGNLGWLRLYRICFLVHGLTWAGAGLVFLPLAGRAESDVLIFALVAMSAGSMIATTFDVIAALLFSVPELAPLAIYLFIPWSASPIVQGLSLLAFIAFTLLSAARAKGLVRKTVRWQLEVQRSDDEARRHAAQAVLADRALVREHGLLKVVLQSTQQGYWFIDVQGVTTDVNPAMCVMLGRTRESIIGLNITRFFEGADLDVLLLQLAAMQNGQPGRYEIGLVRPDGTRLHCVNNATPISDADGTPVGSVGLWTDITARYRSEQDLRTYESALNSITDMVSVVDENLNYRMVNNAWCQATGLARAEAIGCNTRLLFAAVMDEARANCLRECFLSQKIGAVTGPLNVPGLVGREVETIYYPITDGTEVRSVVIVTRDITSEVNLLKLTQKSEAEQRALLDAFPGYISTIDQNFIVSYVNDALASLMQRPVEKIVGRHVRDLMGEDGWKVSLTQIEQAKLLPKSVVERSYPAVGGRPQLDLEVTYVASALQDNGHQTFYAFGHDISERKAAESALRVAAVAFDSQDAMVITDADHVILKANPAFVSITGFEAQEVVGQTPRILKSGHHDATFYKAMQESLAATGQWKGEIWNRRKSGEIYPAWLNISMVRGSDGQASHYVGVHSDLTERQNAEAKIQELAFYDPLTRLPNRALLMDRIRHAKARSERAATHFALLFLDLDNFKTVNESLGYSKGDRLLQQVAGRLSGCVRGGDTVARLGGDEFVVVLSELAGSLADVASQAEAVGLKILKAISLACQIDDVECFCTASIGAVLVDQQDITIDAVLKQAELAMYKAKQNGRNALRFFDPSMQLDRRQRSELESALHKAIQLQQFVLHYQPQVEPDGRVAGAEALIRWQHPQRGMVPPVEFIGLAEEIGLILPIGIWVLETACLQLAVWADVPGMEDLSLAVNVSAKQLHQPDFVSQVIAVLDRTGARPRRLKLELTESIMVADIEDVIAKMTVLSGMGVGFSLDDFGTGYSSLSYLGRLPLDQLKVDRSFVKDIEISDDAVVICGATISLAHSLKLKVVAEGVETEAQRYFLSSVHGCDYIQGYLYSKPLPLQEYEHYAMASGKHRAKPGHGKSR